MSLFDVYVNGEFVLSGHYRNGRAALDAARKEWPDAREWQAIQRGTGQEYAVFRAAPAFPH